MIGILINPNNRIKYSKYSNLILNIIFYLYLFLIRNRLYTFNKSKIIYYRIPTNLSLNSTMNNKR